MLPVHRINATCVSRCTDTKQRLTQLLCFLSQQTANQTRQLAADTLEELHTQGEKLEKVDRDLNDVRSGYHPSHGDSATSRLVRLNATLVLPAGIALQSGVASSMRSTCKCPGTDRHGCEGGQGHPALHAALLPVLPVLLLL